MIGTLEGRVGLVSPEAIIIEAGGVGYRVAVPVRILDRFQEGQTTKVWTYHHLREEASQLFGFTERRDERLFARLLGVNGVGPKVALTLLSLGSAEELESLIRARDVGRLTAMPGIGRKTAERIILELSGALEDSEPGAQSPELEEALVGLGYKGAEARSVLSRVDKKLPEAEQLKEALKMLARQ